MSTYRSLENKLGFDTRLPVDEKWAAAADFLDVVSDFCLLEKPSVIVECSSGISSLVLSRCCQINCEGHVFSLENGNEFVKQSQQQLKDFLLADFCDVVYAPLEDIISHGGAYQWYDTKALPGKVSDGSKKIMIDLLVVDGPPGFLQKNSRYPALPRLIDRLAENCTVFLDDAAREDEKEIVDLWLKQFPEFQLEYIENERGCSILRR